MVQVLKTTEVVTRMAAMGNEIVGSTPEAFDALIRQEIPKWAQVIKAAKITLAP